MSAIVINKKFNFLKIIKKRLKTFTKTRINRFFISLKTTVFSAPGEHI